jgi:hypothetical protein
MSTWYSDFKEEHLSAQNAWYPGTGAAAIVARQSLNFFQLPIVRVPKEGENKTLRY